MEQERWCVFLRNFDFSSILFQTMRVLQDCPTRLNFFFTATLNSMIPKRVMWFSLKGHTMLFSVAVWRKKHFFNNSNAINGTFSKLHFSTSTISMYWQSFKYETHGLFFCAKIVSVSEVRWNILFPIEKHIRSWKKIPKILHFKSIPSGEKSVVIF